MLLRGRNISKLIQLGTEPMTERAFGTEFFQQLLGFVEGLRDKVLSFDQLAKTAFYLRFSQHGGSLPEPRKM